MTSCPEERCDALLPEEAGRGSHVEAGSQSGAGQPASSRAAVPVTCATSQVGTAAPKPSSSTLIWVERSGCGQAKEIAKYSQEIAFYMQPGIF